LSVGVPAEPPPGMVEFGALRNDFEKQSRSQHRKYCCC